MRRIFTLWIAITVFTVAGAFAQEAAGGAVFTLEQCIDYALKNGITMKNAQLDQAIAQAKVKETIGIGLPQISAAGSLVHNPKLPRFFNTYLDAAHSNGGFSFISDADAQAIGLKNGDVFAAQNFFQLPSSGGLSATVNQIIFNGSYFVGLQASKTYKELSQRAANQSKETTIVQVTKAYYAVVINKERIGIFNANIARVDSLLKSTTAQNKNGFAEGIDVDRVQVQYNNLVVERDNFTRTDEIGIALLKFQMNYPMDQPLQVVGSVQDFKIENPVDTYKQDWDYKSRPDYQTLETNRKVQELVIKNKYANGMPVLSAFGTYGYSTQSPTIGGLFKTNTQLTTDVPGIGGDKWYNYSQIGLNLNIPIFSGGQRHYQVQQEKLNLAKIQNNFTALKSSIDLSVEQSNADFGNALKSLTAQQANMDLAARVARITKIKYDQGVGSNIEVVDAENALRNSQLNYYNALYNLMVARVDIDKAYGKILVNNN